MTHSDPPGPKRSTRFNGVVVLMVLLLFVIAGAYVWIQWSADDDSARDEAAGGPVQPAELPDPADGAVRARPGEVPPGVDPSGDASARGVERAHVPEGAEAAR